MDTKTALLDAAELAIRSHGQNGFSYQDLSHAVGIRTASIHYHFPTKSDLILALIQRYTQSITRDLDRLSTAPGTAAARLRSFVEINRNAIRKGHCLCLCVALLLAPEGVSDAGLAIIKTFRQTERDWLANVFSLAVTDGSITGVTDPKSEAAATLALVEGAQVAARATRNTDCFDAATELLMSRMAPEPR